ncbi:glycoside hydrolase family 18 protein [Haladaptatus caseinilyticus]|uniref:glycoside hydrolase family 18 protein n=1 Tax=Haladaptatus caseinilyticus TaxID=2993314 RepID=UPI00224AAED1|nr:glycoside hydrolase family 18 protein [Haladaptatus caseinilyticus]
MRNKNVTTCRRRYLQSAGLLAATPLASRTVGASGADEDDEDDHHRPSTTKRIVGYYPSWAGDYTPHDVPYDNLTHLNYAFLETEADGEVKLAVVGDSAPEVLEQFEAVTHEHPETSFMLSIADFGSNMSSAALTPENRERFARTAIEHMRKYNFDGIDVDWEYPDGSVREEDPENFTLLLEELRRQLDEAEREDDGKTYELSIAAAPIPSNIDPLEVDKIADVLDFINVMNYNFYGSWSSETNFNAPLYAAYDDPTYWQRLLTVDHAMQYWAEQPISRDKLVLGTPFYGFVFDGVTNENRGLFQPFDGADTRTYDDVRTNLKTKPHYQYHWHPDARVPWLYSKEDDVFVTYDDRHSTMEKAKYVRRNGFGGMMCWELSQDPSNTLIGAIHTVLGRYNR